MTKNREQEILNVAREHFVQKGYAATRTQEIADEVGVNKALVHYYFRTKEKLYLEIVKQVLDNMVPRIAYAMSSDGTFWERVETIVEAYTHVLIEQPDTPFFIMSELSQQRERFVAELQKRSAFFPAVQKFIMKMSEEMESGNIKQMPPIHLMLNIMGMTVFPFMAKPIFCTIFSFSESDFTELMTQRKTFIMSFLRDALTPN